MIDYFEKSVSMSSYLVAYVISDFKSVKKLSDKYQIEVEVAGRPEPIENGDGDFALNQAAQILDFFTDYFEVKYPLKKSTQIAIPDFNSGAMENWGLSEFMIKKLFTLKTLILGRSICSLLYKLFRFMYLIQFNRNKIFTIKSSKITYSY